MPLLLWNAANGWVTLKHTQTHAGFEDDSGLHWLGPFHSSSQFAILLGFWFAVWVAAMCRHRPTANARPESSFLWWMSAQTFAFFALFSIKNGGGEANWPIAAYLSGFVLVARSQGSGNGSQKWVMGGRTWGLRRYRLDRDGDLACAAGHATDASAHRRTGDSRTSAANAAGQSIQRADYAAGVTWPRKSIACVPN